MSLFTCSPVYVEAFFSTAVSIIVDSVRGNGRGGRGPGPSPISSRIFKPKRLQIEGQIFVVFKLQCAYVLSSKTSTCFRSIDFGLIPSPLTALVCTCLYIISVRYY